MANDILDAPVKGLELESSNSLSELTALERERLYQYAVNLMTTGFSEDQIHQKLVNRGHSEEIASQVVSELRVARSEVASVAQKQAGNPTLDLVIGGIFLFGGLIGTFSNTGFIFYGAIIFGGIRMVKGIINLSNNN